MAGSIHTENEQILVFIIDELSFALPLLSVVKVFNAVEIRRLPKAPAIIMGIINVKGVIIPVADIRNRLGFETREIDLDDRLIIADTGNRKIAILVDSVTGIRDLAAGELILADEHLPFAEHLKGVVKADDDLILIYDLSAFLDIREEEELDRALTKKM